MCFFETDALSGISSGTKINYVDLYVGYNVSSYSRLIGVMLISSQDSTAGYAVVVSDKSLPRTLGIVFPDYGSISINPNTSYKIRVYYY